MNIIEAETIYGILRNICSFRENIKCKISSCYSDGISNSIFCISFHQNQERITGKITFQGETGKVCRYFYKGVRFEKTSQIIDLLLDLYNYEKKLSSPIE